MADQQPTNAQRPDGALSLPQKVIAIHEALDAAKVPHAIGGALALAYYAEPRMTIDIDLNVFVPTERWPQVRDALAPLGVNVAATTRHSTATARSGSGGTATRRPLLLLRPVPRRDARAARQVPFAENDDPDPLPRALAVCKAMFDRPKDWLDIEQILVATDPLDLPEIEAWLQAMVGEDNPRMKRLHEILAALAIDTSGA